MASTEQTITISQGCTKIVTVHVTGTNPATATAARWAAVNSSGEVLLEKTIADGGIVNLTAPAGETPGYLQVVFFPSDTANIPPAVNYAHELRIKDSLNQQDVVTQGTFKILNSYTDPL